MGTTKHTRERKVRRTEWFSKITNIFNLTMEADVAMIDLRFEIAESTRLGIAWRNPRAVYARRRRHNSAPSLGRGRYVLQEFDGYAGFWRTISDLEVVTGGKAA